MAKIRNPRTLSGHFRISPTKLIELGVFDPTLSVDTKLFVDPLLFANSRQPEFHHDALEQYRMHFESVIKLLALTKQVDDVPWRNARRLLEFHELRGTCLGYGANSIEGNAFGPQLTERILRVGKEIVELGIQDPDLFLALALLEDDIGADRISDMATIVVWKALIQFNDRILLELGLKGEQCDLNGETGLFLINPFQKRRLPIILIPSDVLRKLPIARDWDEVADAAQKTDAIRRRVNQQIGHIWAAKAKRDKAKLRAQALASQTAFQTLLDAIHAVTRKSYDLISDSDGLIFWARKGKEFADRFPLELPIRKPVSSLADLYRVVQTIVAQFRNLVENNGLNHELYKGKDQPRHESSAQRLFFAIAYSYCMANNLDISPEVDSGNGKVDFKFSQGFDYRVLVEVKLSTNTRLVAGYIGQLEAYKQAEATMHAIYLVVDVGHMGTKRQQLIKVRNAARAQNQPLSDLEFVDGIVKPSASKR